MAQAVAELMQDENKQEPLDKLIDLLPAPLDKPMANTSSNDFSLAVKRALGTGSQEDSIFLRASTSGQGAMAIHVN